MENVIKLKKGLDINLKGKATLKCTPFKLDKEYALVPDAFVGMTPKVVVREGDHVKAGEPLFVNKKFPEVGFASPVSGTVTAVIRGERRKLLCVKVEADSKQDFVDFGKKDPSSLSGDEVLQHLLKAGLFGFMRQLPYAVSAEPSSMPKAIFISAFRDMPLSADFDYELEGNEKYFSAGLTALARMAETHVSVSNKQTFALPEVKGVETHVFSGPCPAGNVGVQINHISPVNKGETVWTADPMVVVFIGRLFLDGKVDLRRRVAIAGSEIKDPGYAEILVGQSVKSLLDKQIDTGCHLRIINGNPLTGKPCDIDSYVGALTSEITVIPEGDDRDEFIGWIMPRFKDFSSHRSYFSWLMGKKKEYTLDARIKGGERHIIMSGEYDRVLPMDIYGEYLIKAIISGDIDKMEQLGIYEVAPEDFAVAEFVDSSKLELQRIVREGLDMLRKENA
ncbi:MAG: Na(+)-translocating NADH-quinone reductase subunit A [Prevotella sp.]|nr:Na(+)-translocating NADH-quinone reductase subunit A [Prevotella sp.]